MPNTAAAKSSTEGPNGFDLANISILLSEPVVETGPASAEIARLESGMRESVSAFATRCYLNTDPTTPLEEYMPASPAGDFGNVYTFNVPIVEKQVPVVEMGILTNCRIFRGIGEIARWDAGCAESARQRISKLCPDFRYSPVETSSPVAWLIIENPQSAEARARIEVFGGTGADGFAVIDLAKNETKIYASDHDYYNGRKAPLYTRAIGEADLAIIKEFAQCIESATSQFGSRKNWK